MQRFGNVHACALIPLLDFHELTDTEQTRLHKNMHILQSMVALSMVWYGQFLTSVQVPLNYVKSVVLVSLRNNNHGRGGQNFQTHFFAVLNRDRIDSLLSNQRVLLNLLELAICDMDDDGLVVGQQYFVRRGRKEIVWEL